MTLNITVAARWMMVQSSDFRLTNGAGVVSETSQKQVVLQYEGWSGLVCYTGVARHGSHDTAVWLDRVLTHEGGQRSPGQVVDRLCREGSVWLRGVPVKHRRHTFTMITYESAKPYVYLISNFQRPGGPQMDTPAEELFVTRVRPRKPRCFVTGYVPAVTEQQSMHLTDVLANVPSPTRVREAVAWVSRDAAGRALGTVGQSCVVSHLCPDGSGEAQVFGNLEEAFNPTMITRGRSIAPYAELAMTQAGLAGPQRLVGVTWTSNSAGTDSAMLGAYRGIADQTGTGWEPIVDGEAD
ncbi:hypothetical protein [Nocardia asiatica]|uniref:hypothetical protein n=1 Tax=Nocardia asiatica TaxID=209252 RepID=UPI002455E82A|nr:hypothetical protein [Nocardia asiatica]